MEPNSLTDAESTRGTRLSTLIDKARSSHDPTSYVRERDHAAADRVFSDIASAVERGLRTLEPGSADAAVLEAVEDALKSR